MNKYILALLFSLFVFNPSQSQTYTLNVINGYGSGTYNAGETIHVWSIAYDTTKTFKEWTGDIVNLTNPNEWHSKFIMPNRNASIQATLKLMPSYSVRYENIMGSANMKKVYSCFPTQMRGVIYLFHGTGGSASNWLNALENRSFVNALIADSFGIIITEAEEITLNTDLNGDGKLRWQILPFDSVSGIDYQNIKIITDTFIRRGSIDYAIPKFSVGMSNGGSYSAFISLLYNYKAGISYCASSSAQLVFTSRNNPFAFRMALYDDNAEVGPLGNYQALQFDSILDFRGICHDYEIQDRQPIYAERFVRVPGVSLSTSQSIFTELLNNGQLDSAHYALHSDSIKNHILATPVMYPTIIGLSTNKLVEALNQISASNAEHKFYSDYNYESMHFFKSLCATSVSINNQESAVTTVKLYPNPAFQEIQLELQEGIYDVFIVDIYGRLCLQIKDMNILQPIDISHLTAGHYYIKVKNAKQFYTTSFVIQ